MAQEKYKDDLWDELPLNAYAALGRRGREAIDLRGCFVPECGKGKDNEIHIIEEFHEEIPGSDDTWKTELHQVLMYCEKCKQKFNLVYERKIDTAKAKEDEDYPELGIVMETVRASNEDNTVNYGEIGFVQNQ